MFDEEEEIDDGKSTPEVLRRFIDINEGHIKDSADYIELRNWGRKVDEADFSALVKEHGIEWQIMANLSAKLKDFIKEAEGSLHRKYIRDFVSLIKGMLTGYIERVNIFRKLNKWAEIENPDYMDSQLKFQEDLLKNVHSLNKIMGQINLDDAKEETKKIPIHGDKKVPFLMKEIIEKRFPKQFS